MAKLFANSGNPDQMPHFVPSELGLHCINHPLVVSRLKWVNVDYIPITMKYVPKISLNICFLELLKEFQRNSKTSLNQPQFMSHPCLSHWRFIMFVHAYFMFVHNSVNVFRNPVKTTA